MRRNKQARRIIAKAADVIERDGLAHRDLGFSDGPKCIIGAVSYAMGGSPRSVPSDTETFNKALGLISKALLKGASQGSVSYYSDRHTADEVVTFLREVAK